MAVEVVAVNLLASNAAFTDANTFGSFGIVMARDDLLTWLFQVEPIEIVTALLIEILFMPTELFAVIRLETQAPLTSD